MLTAGCCQAARHMKRLRGISCPEPSQLGNEGKSERPLAKASGNGSPRPKLKGASYQSSEPLKAALADQISLEEHTTITL